MKLRCDITGAELEPLYERIDRQLERLGLETQPEVAARILELIEDDEAPLKAYAEVIATDAGLAGRLLKLANSAHYAQRSAVTTLDRALVVLGLARVKALSLGFYLSRRVPGEDPDLSRQVWGQSVYRASLSAALARALSGQVAAEAYIVGLMLDCAIPLMPALTGDAYVALHAGAATPLALIGAEQNQLEMTHVDVATVLTRRWRLSDVLAQPIHRHHTRPKGGLNARATDSGALLHAIAYCAGSVHVPLDGPADDVTLPAGKQVLTLGDRELDDAIADAAKEYEATSALFAERAACIADLESMARHIQAQLVESLDAGTEEGIRMEMLREPVRFRIDEQTVEIEASADGQVTAFIATSSGERVVSCVLSPGRETAETMRRKLCLESAMPAGMDELVTFVQSIAA